MVLESRGAATGLASMVGLLEVSWSTTLAARTGPDDRAYRCPWVRPAAPWPGSSRMAKWWGADEYQSMGKSVLIVDDHPSFRASARRMLEAHGYEVVGEAGDGGAALLAAGQLRPEV